MSVNRLQFIALCRTSVLAGYFSMQAPVIQLEGRIGLFSKAPPQFGHTFCKILITHSLQNVHSNEQIIASKLVLGKDLLQCSQLGLICNIISFN